MDIINPDLSHNNFLELANADIKSANALLQIKEYHNAVYHFQQSVEKSCKYLGLTMKAFTFDELRQISHEPQKVFDKVFYNEVFTSVSDNQDYEEVKKIFKDADLNKKCDGAYYYIDKAFRSSSLNSRPYSEQVIEYFDNNPFSDLYNADFAENIKKHRGNFHVETACKQFLDMLDDMQKCLLCQMLMSLLVSGVEANSRYPDREGITPNEIYSEKSFIVQYLDYFIEKQFFCIKILGGYFKPIENL